MCKSVLKNLFARYLIFVHTLSGSKSYEQSFSRPEEILPVLFCL